MISNKLNHKKVKEIAQLGNVFKIENLQLKLQTKILNEGTIGIAQMCFA